VLAGTLEPATDAQVPLLRDRGLVNGLPAVYVCERFACQLPVIDVASLLGLLEE
jgi:uncharacterized protein YyaL (SSP411 family)